jgi:hypothetical protein
MPGVRQYNFRQGDRSEYLAQYLLSGLGLVTPVPRQEDIGVDFYCLLADQESGLLTFGFPHMIQIKSFSENEVRFGGLRDKKWHREAIDWLFRQELPLLFGFVDKAELKMEIHCISSLWFLMGEELATCGEIILQPRRDPSNIGDIGKPHEEPFGNVPPDALNGKRKFVVDIGQPIVTIRHSDLDDKNYCRLIKELLRQTIILELGNIMYRRLGVPYMNWVLSCITNQEIKTAWAYFAGGPQVLPVLWRSATPSIIALGINADLNDDANAINTIRPIVKFLPSDMIYSEIRKKHPRVFE